MRCDHVDVLIIGAGLSGIGAACHLRAEVPGATFAILEARGAIGGTWDLFRYPGVRSDSDMYTLGYRFRPWSGATLADGGSIRAYVRQTARDHGVDSEIRFHHRVLRADWSSEHARWTVLARRSDTGEDVRITCGFLFGCTGYYRYDEGYTPPLPGIDDFAGPVVHPQAWPADLDYRDRRVVVIGSGATAVTLVPAMATDAAHVTMLQRSPTYVAAVAASDPVVRLLRRLPARLSYPVVRWKNVLLTMASFALSRRRPALMKALLRKGASRLLPRGYDVDTHFAPRYDPWDQRLCLAPDGDLFAAIRRGRASVVTDTIDAITEHGIRLASGAELPADIIVTATGLNLLALGGMSLSIDGRAVELPELVTYKGMMLSGVPNFALTVGYSNASWTLKADLVAHYVCRLLRHMRRNDYQVATPSLPAGAESWPRRPLIELTSGYVLRGLAALPKQGPAPPWRLYQNYLRDVLLMRRGPLTGDGMRFSRLRPSPAQPARAPTEHAAS
jgi:monooxygenase